MLISKKHRRVIINSRHPERITTVIPHARKFDFKGRELVAVKHDLDETKILRNIGYEVPSPVAYYYEWSGRYKPFSHQRVTVEFLTLNTRAFVLSSMGVGKSLSALWAYDYLRHVGKAKKLLVVSPLSTLERVWADELFQHFPHLTFSVLHGSAERRRKLLAQDVDVYIINHDGVKVLKNELLAREDINVVVVDELASFRNSSTDRWKCLNMVLTGRNWVWGMTGSPTPNAPTDAWAQVRLISPDRVPRYFGRFRDLVMRQINQFKWVPRPEAMEVVKEAMQPTIRFTLDDCLDLPEQIHETRDVPLGTEQQAMYNDMLNKLKAEYGGGQVTAVNEAVKVMRLIQIACGAPYGVDGEAVFVPAKERVEAVKEIIEQAEAKVIVFVPFTGALKNLAAELAKQWEVGVVYGGSTKSERDATFAAFQKGGTMKVLVANPATLSHGLTLTAANTIVWFSAINSNETYQQACARVRRPGQKRTTVIVHLSGTNAEKKMYDRLRKKEATQGVLLDLIKDETIEKN